MVPRKKGKRIININNDNREPQEHGYEFSDEVDEEHEIPSALSRALDKAEDAEKDILKAKIEELEERVSALGEELNKERANLQNFRRRADEEKLEARKYGAYDLGFDLLNILDCFEMGMNCEVEAPPEALKPYIEGVEYTIQELSNVLRKNSIVEIPTDIPYDPSLHQVFECVEDSGEAPGTILQVNRKGYRYHDRILRNALVVISGTVSECPADSGEGED